MGTLQWSAFRQFSHPGVAFDEAFFAAVAEAYTRITIEEVLRPDVGPRVVPPQLLEPLKLWSDRTKPLAYLWLTSIGKLAGQVLAGRRGWLPDLLARVCVDLIDQLDDFCADFALASTAPLLIGRHFVRPGRHLTLAKAGIRACIRFAADSSGCREISSGCCTLIAQDRDIIAVPTKRRVRIVEARAMAATGGDPCGIPVRWDDLVRLGQHDTVVAGLHLLETCAPDYHRWVTRVVNTIIVIPTPPTGDCSGSWPDSSGCVYLSQPISALKVAEVLVHEASHQYFHMAERISPSKRPDEHGLYYSPSVGTERPLDRILLAYHAFANVLNFYSKLAGDWTRHAWLPDRVRQVNATVEVLDTPLRRMQGLSELGAAIYLPLQMALAQSLRGPMKLAGERAALSVIPLGQM